MSAVLSVLGCWHRDTTIGNSGRTVARVAPRYLQVAHQIIRESLFLHERYRNLTELGCVRHLFRPILGTLGFVVFLQIRKHYNNLQVLFPNHSPKIVDRTIHRTLGTNEFLALLVAEHKVSVDIVGTDRAVAFG